MAIDVSNINIVTASGVKYSVSQGTWTKVSDMFGLGAEDIYADLDRTQVALLWPDLHVNLFSRHLVFLRSFFFVYEVWH